MEENVIRVAHIVGEMNGGGVEAVVMNYFRHIDRTKVQFDFIAQETSTRVPREEIEKLGGRVFYLPPYKHICKYRKALYRILKENGYTIVHSHINTLSVFSLSVAKKAGIKVRIAHSHSTSNKKEWKRNFLKNLLRPFSKRYATHFFACSEYAGKWLFGKRAFEDGKVKIINNAIEPEKFAYNPAERDALRSELGLDGKYVIGHVGRFVAQKNHSFLIDVFDDLQKRDKDARLLLVGDGPLLTETERKVRDLGLADKVVFAGVRSDVERFYQAMDCFVLPSLYEGLPVVGVEAQAAGLPVVASDAMTEETKITPLLKFIRLGQSAANWSGAIEKYKNFERVSSCEMISAAGYDIDREAGLLAEFYLGNA